MHSSTTTPDEQQPSGYPGRDRLDNANRGFRRALARLAREGRRHDPELLPEVERIATEAADHLERLAKDATEAEGNSARHRAALAREQESLTRTLRKLSRSNPTLAARIARGAAEQDGAADE
ncbi:hypothetical protein [Streptomyces sp. MAR25Y5]|uniref:hypothetical protein n=1 Tax=Streptomyces sp. MAR25Y5 TaxID=2962028 RepID=UPI0020B7D0BB|nr:hypothetical protein [Streptomyces sp. MAR25Y5]MCP3769503.1 hypothetical protein [Streptomyces sp. MAR25Y5]